MWNILTQKELLLTLFCKDKRNWLVDTVVVLGIVALIVKYFVL